MRSVKCVIVGDAKIGKTTLDITYRTGVFGFENKSFEFEEGKSIITIDGEPICLVITDPICIEGHEKLRPLSYPHVDVFIICFSLVNHSSFTNVRSKWYPEVHYYCPNTPIILVGTKLDLRENEEASANQIKLTALTYAQGLLLAKEIGADKYVECSALTQNALIDVFDEAVRAALKVPDISKKHRRCNIF